MEGGGQGVREVIGGLVSIQSMPLFCSLNTSAYCLDGCVT